MRYGRESAAARVLEVEVDEDGWLVIGEPGTAGVPTAPDILELVEGAFLGVCCRRSWRALARAFSCVRTKWARFYRGSGWVSFSRRLEILAAYLYKELPILTIHHRGCMWLIVKRKLKLVASLAEEKEGGRARVTSRVAALESTRGMCNLEGV